MSEQPPVMVSRSLSGSPGVQLPSGLILSFSRSSAFMQPPTLVDNVRVERCASLERYFMGRCSLLRRRSVLRNSRRFVSSRFANFFCSIHCSLVVTGLL